MRIRKNTVIKMGLHGEDSDPTSKSAYFHSNPTPRLCLPPDFFAGAEADVVDTALTLGTPGSNKSRNAADQLLVIDATPLRWAFPAAAESRKTDHQRKKRRSEEEEEEEVGRWNCERALIPMQGLLRAVELRGGSRAPVFLYRKKLEKSDVGAHHNRLMVTRRERLMKFLREEEAEAVVNGGLRIVGVDGGGNVYDKLMLKKWPSMNVMVINSVEWKKVVANNHAQKGHLLEIWGYRENHKPCLAFNFSTDN